VKHQLKFQTNHNKTSILIGNPIFIQKTLHSGERREREREGEREKTVTMSEKKRNQNDKINSSRLKQKDLPFLCRVPNVPYMVR
jgi:hypothetical protein